MIARTGRSEIRQFARRAFTLIELLVCITIIGILASLLATTLGRARSTAQGMYCMNNLRQIGLACQMYALDFQDRLPYNLGQADIARMLARNWYWNWSTPVMNWNTDSDNTNTVLLTKGGIGPYTSCNSRIYRCPSDTALSEIQREAGWSERVRSFSMNAMTGNAGEYTMTGSNTNNPGYRQYFRLGDIENPTYIYLFIEEHPDSINDGYFINRHDSGRWTDLPASYHNGAANLVFADGHSQSRTWKYSSTRPPARPEASGLPIRIPPRELGDFQWLMYHTSADSD